MKLSLLHFAVSMDQRLEYRLPPPLVERRDHDAPSEVQRGFHTKLRFIPRLNHVHACGKWALQDYIVNLGFIFALNKVLLRLLMCVKFLRLLMPSHSQFVIYVYRIRFGTPGPNEPVFNQQPFIDPFRGLSFFGINQSGFTTIPLARMNE